MIRASSLLKYGETETEDLVQDFSLTAFTTELFAKADPARGRFRNFLVKSLGHFLSKEWSDALVKKGHPGEGFVSMHELVSEAGPVVAPKDMKTPDEAFHRAWLCELVLRVLRTVEREYSANGETSSH